jgi:hypothetical protein
LHWQNGDRYIGFVKNGALHGYGHYIYPDGVYAADWNMSMIDLDKFVTLPDGSKYRGGMRERKLHGKGENFFPDGSFYNGNYNLG